MNLGGVVVLVFALLNLVLTIRRRARAAGIAFSLVTVAIAVAVATNVLPLTARWIAGGAIEGYVLFLAARAIFSGRGEPLAEILPAPFVRVVQTEVRLVQLALRAPALLGGVRRAGPETYDQTSEWSSFAMIALVGLVPDSVLMAILPMPLWAHVLLIAAGVYATMWVTGAYASTVQMPHVITPDVLRFHNGLFSEVDASGIDVTCVRRASADERRLALRREADARAMLCPGVAFARVDFDGAAELRPLVGPPREVRGHLFVPSDQPRQLASALLRRAGIAETECAEPATTSILTAGRNMNARSSSG